MTRPRLLCHLILSWLLFASAGRGETLAVLRTHPGRFLRPDAQGVLRADRMFPDVEATFRLVAGPSGRVALRHDRGWVFPFGPAASPRLRIRPGTPPLATVEPVPDQSPADPVPPEAWLVLEPLEDNRVVLYHVGQTPEGTRAVLAAAIQALVVQELAERTYDKTRRRKKEEHIRLPAPTLEDLGRTRRHRVLSTDEETRLRAELDGQPTITITQMPYLKGYRRPQEGVLLLVVRAEVPVRGRVGYRIPRAMDVSTNYLARVRLAVVSQITARRAGDTVSLEPPEVLDMEVRLLALDLSNDLLNSARGPIRDAINEELERKEPRIRQQANKAIRKAVDAQEFRLPLLRYLLQPEPEEEK